MCVVALQLWICVKNNPILVPPLINVVLITLIFFDTKLNMFLHNKTLLTVLLVCTHSSPVVFGLDPGCAFRTA